MDTEIKGSGNISSWEANTFNNYQDHGCNQNAHCLSNFKGGIKGDCDSRIASKYCLRRTATDLENTNISDTSTYRGRKSDSHLHDIQNFNLTNVTRSHSTSFDYNAHHEAVDYFLAKQIINDALASFEPPLTDELLNEIFHDETDFPVEIQYLPNFDILGGNMDIVTSNLDETDVEITSFTKALDVPLQSKRDLGETKENGELTTNSQRISRNIDLPKRKILPDFEFSFDFNSKNTFDDDTTTMENIETFTNNNWQSVRIADQEYEIDTKVIEPYKKVIAHGGYYEEGFKAIIVFCSCYLPDKKLTDYDYIMDNLFLYVISTLELLVIEDYMIVFFHGASPKNKMPSLVWLKKCCDMIDKKLKKNLSRLLIVHPTIWLKTLFLIAKPFYSSSFGKKVEYIRNLKNLKENISTEYIFVPKEIIEFDVKLKGNC